MRIKTLSDIKSILPIECIDPKRNVWRLRWDFQENNFEEIQLNHKPSIEEVKRIILDWIDTETSNRIIYGFKWADIPVCLTKENQSNYNLFCDTELVPIELKFGTWDNPKFYKIETLDEMKKFKRAMSEHIKNCLQLGWSKKKNLDWSIYEKLLNNN